MAKQSNPFNTTIFRKEEVRDARNWFKNKVNSISKDDLRGTTMSDLRYRGDIPIIGRMLYFGYQAKYDKILPYWDKFPLIIVINEDSKYVQGINLHYLPPKLRSALLSRMMETINNDRFDKTTKFKVTYGILKAAAKFRYFKPCIKLYLKSNVRSKMMIIRPEQWHKAILLPTARFKGATASAVWKDSKGKF